MKVKYVKLEIKEEEVGREYFQQLKKVIAIRKERRLLYMDSFLQEMPEELMSIVNGKRKRFEILYSHKDRKRNFNVMRKIKDEIYDMINYLLFLVCVIEKKEKIK